MSDCVRNYLRVGSWITNTALGWYRTLEMSRTDFRLQEIHLILRPGLGKIRT